MIIVYPATGAPEETVTLPNPEFGNIDRTDTNAIFRTSRHGEALNADEWPQVETKVYNIQTMTESVRSEFMSLLLASAGLEVKLTDHLGTEYDGFIITPSNEIITTKDHCSYDASFEFMETI